MLSRVLQHLPNGILPGGRSLLAYHAAHTPLTSPLTQVRLMGSFFKSRDADMLWKATTSVSSQGRQRGRARGMAREKNLHKGQKLGMGTKGMLWPGLNTRVEVSIMPKDKRPTMQMDEGEIRKYEEDVLFFRDKGGMKKVRRSQTPLERGWTSASPQGKLFGAPIPTISSLDYSGFESILLQMRMVSHMNGRFGRLRRSRIVMMTGNGNGLAGFTVSSYPFGRGFTSLDKSVNRAGLKLISFGLYDDRTVYHDFFCQFGDTRIFVKQCPPGSGVNAHRILKAACRLIGIRDLECHIEGPTNAMHVIRAFFLGLMRMRTHQTLADEKQLILVEMREENDNFPKVVASPSNGKVRTKEEIDHNEVLDFEMISYDGNLPYIRPPKSSEKHDISKYPGYDVYLKRRIRQMHYTEQKLQMMNDYGQIESHLTGRYPECSLPQLKTSWEKEEENSSESSE